jgi:NAD(P)-dependent dehydrogenase (short-subunit alcohol dehydrogenase family)
VSAPGRFAGQVVVVTGAASGIGRATAEAFAAEGGGSPGSTCGPARCRTGRRAWRATWATRPRSARPFARVRAELGPVDVLVAAAGVAFRRQEVQDRVLANVEAAMGGGALAPLRAASTLDDERWDRALRVALYGTFHCCREALRDMEDRGSGAIVALGSVYGVMGCDIMPEYGAAKGGVIAFAKGLAREVLPAGVRVNVVPRARAHAHARGGPGRAARRDGPPGHARRGLDDAGRGRADDPAPRVGRRGVHDGAGRLAERRRADLGRRAGRGGRVQRASTTPAASRSHVASVRPRSRRRNFSTLPFAVSGSASMTST